MGHGPLNPWQPPAIEGEEQYAQAHRLEPEPSHGKRQICAIIAASRKLRIDPKCVPVGKKQDIKTECLQDKELFTVRSFDSAWARASKNDRISIEGKARFKKRR